MNSTSRALSACRRLAAGRCLLAFAALPLGLLSGLSSLADPVSGTFGSVTNWPLIPIHAALTPDGRVLSYGTDGTGKQTGFFVYDIWDPADGFGPQSHVTLNNMTLTDIFCSSQVILPKSGGILIAGGDNWTGTNTTNTGNRNSNIYDPTSDTLTRQGDMGRERWYSSATVLMNGDVYIQGGNGGGDYPEVRTDAGAFRLLTAASTGSLAATYPRNFLAPDGRVFGYDTNGKMYYVDTRGTGVITNAGQFESQYAGWTSSAAMFRPGRILQVGGNGNLSLIVDINGPTPVLTPSATMTSMPGSTRRQWVSATVLANGKVLATGGSQTDNQLSFVNNTADIWDPATGQWTSGAVAVRARLYHSGALLLPDATVMVGGGGAPGPLVNTNIEIYYPPYLYSGPNTFATRPAILSAPDTLTPGQSFQVLVNDPAVSRLTLVKTGSITHSVNMDQRFVEVPFIGSSGTLQAQLPARISDTPPGFYMLFALNAAGVPSHAKIVRVNVNTPESTVVPVDYTPFIGSTAGTAFTLQCNADETLVGAHGKINTYVGNLGPRCVQVDQFGQWIGNPVNRTQTGTNQFGTSFTRTCPPNWAVSGFRGRSGSYVDQLELECRALTSSGGLTGSGQWLGANGGTGGTAQGPYSCGTGNPAYAFFGRSATFIHQVGLLCRQAPITPIITNTAPTIGNPGPLTSARGAVVSRFIEAFDPDDDPLTYSAVGLPPGLAVNPSSGEISGMPTTVGNYGVTIQVSDGAETASAGFTWSIIQVADLELVPMPVQAALVTGTQASYTAQVQNAVNPRFKWNFNDGSPETAYSTSPSVTHVFTQPGVYYVTVTATDDRGIERVQSFAQAVHLPLTANGAVASTNLVYEPRSGSPDRLWLANQDNDSVSVFDTATGARLKEIAVGKAPRSLAIAPDGRVWVTNKGAASISIVDPVSLSVSATVTLPPASQPFGIVFAPTGSYAYVVLEARGELLKLNATTGSEVARVSVGSNVRHVAIVGDGSKLYVSRFVTPPLPGESTASVATGSSGGHVLEVGSASMTINRTIVLTHSNLPDAENQGAGVPNYLGAAVISPDGSQAWVPSKQDNIKRGMLRNGQNLNFQNTVRAIASRVDLAAGTEDASARVDLDNASLGSAAAFDPLGNYVFVALETSREVAVLDAHAGIELFRISAGRAPQGVAVSDDGLRLYVNNFMDRTVTVYDLTQLKERGQWNAPLVATLTAIGTEKLSAQILRGKQLFYDAFDPRLARDRYMSCASCHNDGGHDGRVWDLTGFGEGLRNTISLRGRGDSHGPLHWTANFDEVQDFEGQIRLLAGGTGLMADADFVAGTRSEPLGDPKAGLSADLDALAAYVESLVEFADSPYRAASGSLTTQGLAGKTVFAEKGCATCHGGDAFSDSGTLHDIGTITAASGQRLGLPLTGLDTPTLRDVWSTAPYLHDGSAATIAAAVAAHDGLTVAPEQVASLAAYLEQVDASEPAPPPVANDTTPPAVESLSPPANATGVPTTAVVTATFNESLDATSVSGSTFEVRGPGGAPVSGTVSYDAATRTARFAPAAQLSFASTFTATLRGGANDPRIKDVAGNPLPGSVIWSFTTAAPADLTPPTVPAAFVVTGKTSTSISVSWTASVDSGSGLAGYRIYLDGGLRESVAASTTSYAFQGLSSSTTYVLGVSAVDVAGNESAAAQVSETTEASGSAVWQSQDIGAVAAAGSFSQSANVLTVTGSGADIWKSADEFHFVWQPLTGDGEIRARVVNWSNPYRWSKAGVMVREQLTAGSRYGFAMLAEVDGRGGGSFQYRTATDANAGPNGSLVATALVPYWVRVVREGDVLRGYLSADGVSWTLRNTAALSNLAGTVYVGLAVASHNDGQLTTVQFDNVQIAGSTAGDTSAPTVPANLVATVVGTSRIDLSWSAATDNTAVTGYRVYRDGVEITTIAGTTFSDVGRTANTTYSYRVSAFDAAGNVSAQSPAVSATTEALVDVTPPSVPASLVVTGKTATSIALSWSASVDTESGIGGYRVYVGGVLTETLAAGSSSYTVAGLSPSTTYVLGVSAVDVAGNESSAAQVSETTEASGSIVWQSQDIGAVAAAGSFSQSGGVFTVAGSGADIWKSADEFHFVWQPLTGDGEIRARVVNWSNPYRWSKAGVMVREQLTAGSRYGFALLAEVDGGGGGSFQYRTAAGTDAGPNGSLVATALVPYWVRVVREGDVLRGYLSANGVSWTLRNTATLSNLAGTVYVGLAVTSHNDGQLTTVQFDNVEVSGN